MQAVDLGFFFGLLLLTISISVIDVSELRIPDRHNMALAALGFGRSLYHDPTLVMALTAIGGAAFTLAMIAGAMRLADRLDRPAMGWGDVKFLAAASFWVGFAGSVVTFVIAGIVALIWAAVNAPWRGLDLHRRVALGPMLAAGLNLVFLTSSMAQPR